MTRPRRSLFMKYFVTLFVAVVAPLVLGSATEAWFAFRDNRIDLNERLQVEARSAADRIQAFTDGIRDQLGWVVQFPWTEGEDDRHRIDGLAPAAAGAGDRFALAGRPDRHRTRFRIPREHEQDRPRRGYVGRSRGRRRARQPGLVRPGALSARFRALHADRGCGKPCGRRNCRCRHQSEADLGHHRGDQDRRYRPRPCRRRLRAPDRPPGHQPGPAQRCRGGGLQPAQVRGQRRRWIGGLHDRRGWQARCGALGARRQCRLDRHRGAAGAGGVRIRSAPRCGAP